MEVGIVAKRGSDRAVEVAATVAAVLADEDCTAVAEATLADRIGAREVSPERLAACDLVVSIGGDGTFLHATHRVDGTPLLGVNLGEVGFLNPVPPDDAGPVVREAVRMARTADEPAYREAMRLSASGSDWTLPPALNEVVVTGARRGPGGQVDLAVTVDGESYRSGPADGVLVATPTGSTAYNLSEGGPLVHPAVSGMVITGMAAMEPMPPLVVGPDHRVRIRATAGAATETPGRTAPEGTDPDEAVVAVDGGHRRRVSLPATVTVERAAVPTRIAGPLSDFFTALDKLD